MDVGTKRTGMAISDELGITAQGLETLQCKGDEIDLDAIVALARERQVSEIVVGLPLNMNGSTGPRAEAVIKFVESLKAKIDLPIKMWDERLSSMQVERVMLEADISRKKRKRARDKLAAQVILQGYLDSKGMQKDV